MKKKLTALALVIVMVAMLFTGLTMAYFTDTDEATNTFTVGNVDIQIREEQGKYDDQGNLEGYVPFEQGKEMVPGQLVEKFVYVDNTGKNDAYVRTRILIPMEYADALRMTISATWKGWWYFNDGTEDNYNPTKVEYDGKEYLQYTFLYQHILKSGEKMYAPLLTKVSLHPTFDWLDQAKGWYTLGNGEDKVAVTVTDTYIDPTVVILADAIQAEGFDDVYKAFAAFDAQGAAGNDIVVVSNVEELAEALASGADVVLDSDINFTAADLNTTAASIPVALAVTEDAVLNLNGHNITLPDTGADTTAVIYVQDANLTIKGEGTVTQNGTSDFLLWAKGDSNVNIMGGTYVTAPDDCSVLYASGNVAYSATDPWATINVYNGTFTSGNINDSQDCANVMNHGVGRVNYYGGTYNWNPAGEDSWDYNWSDDKAYIKVADGYTVQTNSDGTYTVVAQ